MPSDNNSLIAPRPSRKMWVYGIIVVLTIAAMAYYALLNQKDRSTNHDYYRVLYEASNTFNENLSKLDSMHSYKESVSSIRSLLPSYTRDAKPDTRITLGTINKAEEGSVIKEIKNVSTAITTLPDFQYILETQTLAIVNKEFTAKLAFEDILPVPKKGFSQYLFADEKGRVIATVGGERTISIVDLDSINLEIMRKNKQFQLNFSDPKDSGDDGGQPSLPTYSNHVDMKISYGDFRVYVFPFTLKTKLIQTVDNQPKDLERLYLVGLLPQENLASRGSGYWNISLLVVTVFSLLFMWTILRLYLLPQNQSITTLNRVGTLTSSYLFYIVIIGLLLAYFQKSVLQYNKDKTAIRYAESLDIALNNDLAEVFTGLSGYREFYLSLIQTLTGLSSEITEYCVVLPETKNNDDQVLNKKCSDIDDKNKGDIHHIEINNELEVVDAFNKAIGAALLTMPMDSCEQNRFSTQFIGTAAYKGGTFPITITCPEPNSHYVLLPAPKSANVRLNADAIKTLYRAFTANTSEVPILDFHAANQTVNVVAGESLTSSIQTAPPADETNQILSVFALNSEGNSLLSSIYFQESNALPETFNLSHRNYYKMVRDEKGWALTVNKVKTGQSDDERAGPPTRQSNQTAQTCTFNNVYIQRLLNVNNGTRGTTISMPIRKPQPNHPHTANDSPADDTCGESAKSEITDQMQDKTIYSYIIGADVLLPSLSLGKSPPQDFNYMVVERSSGDVLFHNDSGRSLIENLYFAGESRSALSQRIKAGMDLSLPIEKNIVKGNYHGQEGRFIIKKTAVDNWALVVFYPNDSLSAMMTNQFLYISTTFGIIIGLMVLLLFAMRYLILTRALKRKLHLPAKLNMRLVILVSSVYLSVSYCLFIFGQNIDYFLLISNERVWSVVLPVVGLLIATWVVYKGCYNHFCLFYKHNSVSVQKLANHGSKRLISVILITVVAHYFYLQKTADAPLKSLQRHYAQIACNWRNYEQQELISIGLSRYPNSITTYQVKPKDLLPIEKDWREELSNTSHPCQHRAAQINPDDYPSLGSLISTSYIWQWIDLYLFNDAAVNQTDQQANIDKLRLDPLSSLPIGLTVLNGIVLSLVIWFWFRFNSKMVWNRLYCPERFLQHIQRISRSVKKLKKDEHNENLKIICDTVKLNGIGLALLLRSISLQKPSDKQTPQPLLMEGFEYLFNISPCLQSLKTSHSYLPNVKLNVVKDPKSHLLDIQIWDIETCIEKVELRQHLLDLIMEIKSLTLSGALKSFTIYTGFHSLQRVKMKDPLMLEQHSRLDHSEYLSWSECLMDFIVVVPESFENGVDWAMLEDEVAFFPELHFLKQDKKGTSLSPLQGNGIWRSNDERVVESRWATINYILLNAEALYRFKWESCSSEEKLALLNLAKQQRLNPTNTQMIEHLALNGLIRVREGHLNIVNKSFAHFVLHAETRETLAQLVSHGEAGVWKNYRLPLGILILLIIGGIALTSGESIYIIAASMAGVLGTIASVTNSANLLRGQMKD